MRPDTSSCAKPPTCISTSVLSRVVCRLIMQAVAAPKSDPVFLHVKAAMTVIVTNTEGAWRMADVIWVDGGARNPKVPTLLQVADVDTGVINRVNADLVTHIVPRF